MMNWLLTALLILLLLLALFLYGIWVEWPVEIWEITGYVLLAVSIAVLILCLLSGYVR